MDCIDYEDGFCSYHDVDCDEHCGEDPENCSDYIPRDEEEDVVVKDLFT